MTTLQPIFPERCKGSKFRPVSWSDIYKEGAPVVGWGIEEKQAEPRSLFDRANDLHEKAAMPWTEAEKLALSEQGIDDAQIEELIHEHASTALVEFTKGWEDLQEYTRALLVHAVAHPAPKALAPHEDTKLLDYLQARQATVEILMDGHGLSTPLFRIGGLHGTICADIRGAIGAAIESLKEPTP